MSIRGTLSGSFTATAGDVYSLGGLYTGTAPAGGSIAGYKVAVRGGAAGSCS